VKHGSQQKQTHEKWASPKLWDDQAGVTKNGRVAWTGKSKSERWHCKLQGIFEVEADHWVTPECLLQ
jgi:hypothetical protein